MEIALFWLLLNIVTLICNCFFSMAEMACVSFNKVRLQYYVSKKDPRALLLNDLLKNPSNLFATTLLGVNAAMFFGSEFSRQFHTAIGIDPDWAPLSQVVIVVIFTELAPIFAARRYAEHVSLLSARLLWFFSKLMTPLLWAIKGINQCVHYLIGGKEVSSKELLTQEELHHLITGLDDEEVRGFDAIVSNIFSLRSQSIEEVIVPLSHLPVIPHHATVNEMRKMLKRTPVSFLPVYEKSPRNIIGIAYVRDYLRSEVNDPITKLMRQPWLITPQTEIAYLLRQFRSNRANMAVCLNSKGRAVGIVTLKDLLLLITEYGQEGLGGRQVRYERTFPADITLKELNSVFDVPLVYEEAATLGEVVILEIGHQPEVGESVTVGPYTLTVKEATLFDVKSVTIKL